MGVVGVVAVALLGELDDGAVRDHGVLEHDDDPLVDHVPLVRAVRLQRV